MPRLSEQAQQDIERSHSQGHDPLAWESVKEVADLAQEFSSCSASALDGCDPDRPAIYVLPELAQSMVGNVVGLPQRWLNHASEHECRWCLLFVSSWHCSEAKERERARGPYMAHKTNIHVAVAHGVESTSVVPQKKVPAQHVHNML